jgi:hypothetical protein
MTGLQARAAARFLSFAFAAVLALWSGQARAVTDEIQVYTGEIVAPGVLGLTWHNNYTPSGATTPAYPGALIDDQAYSSVTEWAYGVTPWLEFGLYFPLFSHTRDQGWTYNGFKLRALFVQPDNQDKKLYYGVNFEFSWNQKWWEEKANSGEIRPIIGWRFDDGVSITFNPIFDYDYTGFSRLEFVPATRLDYALNDTWTIAVEEYDDFGNFHSWLPSRDQWHQLWGVVDYGGNPISVEAGVGFGLTPGTDDVAFKLMFSSDLTGMDGLFSR